MPPLSHLLAFALTSLILIVVPGPSVLFTVSRALTIGRRGALLTVLGNAAGQSLQVVAVALGLGAVVERSIVAYTVVKFVGAGYLVFLGVQAIRHRRALTDAMAGELAPLRSTRRVVADGFVVGLTNPKTIVVFVAALPQFLDKATGHPTAQLLILGLMFPCIALVSDSVWAVAAGSVRTWFARSPQRMSAVGGVGGFAMIGIGATLAVSGRKE
jgi:threonine/homoserine/homoserine lactone efflux protein